MRNRRRPHDDDHEQTGSEQEPSGRLRRGGGLADGEISVSQSARIVDCCGEAQEDLLGSPIVQRHILCAEEAGKDSRRCIEQSGWRTGES